MRVDEGEGHGRVGELAPRAMLHCEALRRRMRASPRRIRAQRPRGDTHDIVVWPDTLQRAGERPRRRESLCTEPAA